MGGKPLEKEIPNLETAIFRGELLVLGSVTIVIVSWYISPIYGTRKLRKEGWNNPWILPIVTKYPQNIPVA